MPLRFCTSLSAMSSDTSRSSSAGLYDLPENSLWSRPHSRPFTRLSSCAISFLSFLLLLPLLEDAIPYLDFMTEYFLELRPYRQPSLVCEEIRRMDRSEIP